MSKPTQISVADEAGLVDHFAKYHYGEIEYGILDQKLADLPLSSNERRAWQLYRKELMEAEDKEATTKILSDPVSDLQPLIECAPGG